MSEFCCFTNALNKTVGIKFGGKFGFSNFARYGSVAIQFEGLKIYHNCINTFLGKPTVKESVFIYPFAKVL